MIPRFRVYNTDHNFMDDDVYISGEGKLYQPPSIGYNTPHTEIERCDYPIMQYVGFTDKNGKGIYVSDYIKYLGKTYQVIQDFTGAFAGKNKEFGEKSLFICYIYTECEVIGNIYQTLEEK